MSRVTHRYAGTTLGFALLTGLMACNAGVVAGGNEATTLPDPAMKGGTAGAGEQVAVFAGGCFWGVEGVFEHVKGVTNAVSGYAGGTPDNARYDAVSRGDTGHAEAVKVTYDPAQISYGQLLKVYFSVAHDPTQLNRQGPDRGTQYRSQIFTTDTAQQKIANAYITQLNAAKSFPAPIVTKVAPLQAFHPAEKYHQDYMQHHPNEPYIVYNDAPKLVHLKQQFPALYTGRGSARSSIE